MPYAVWDDEYKWTCSRTRLGVSRLTQIRDLLGEVSNGSSTGASSRVSSRSSEPKRRGRSRESKNKSASFNPEEFAPKPRTMAAAGKERIAATQQARWGKQKETASLKKSRATAGRQLRRRRPGRNR